MVISTVYKHLHFDSRFPSESVLASSLRLTDLERELLWITGSCFSTGQIAFQPNWKCQSAEWEKHQLSHWRHLSSSTRGIAAFVPAVRCHYPASARFVHCFGNQEFETHGYMGVFRSRLKLHLFERSFPAYSY